MNKIADSARFCPQCGAPLPPESRFCSNCGQARRQPRRRSKRVLPLLALALLVIISSIIVILLIGQGDPGEVAGNLVLGQAVSVADQDLPADGGVVTVDNPASTLDGLSITVPAGAYDAGTNFSIAESPIESHNFGKLFNPATPLITVENGHAFASQPMTVRIPVQIGRDEFAMAFYYDRQNGKLEGIPCLAQDASSITIVTAHFSELLVTKADFADLDRAVSKAAVDSGFRPGRDDFLAPNYGSFAAQGGHCAGQSIAALHFYNTHRALQQPIRSEAMVDNGAEDATPDFFWDDALAYRLCSQLQILYQKNWNQVYDAMRDVNEELTYYSFLYAIKLTGAPQYIHISTTNLKGGHAMIVYKVTRDALWIADPNLPGDLDRKIAVSRELSIAEEREKVSLGTYFAQPDANGQVDEYPWIAYYGAYALIDKTVIDGNWQTVLNGQDAAFSVFPPDAGMVAATGRDASGKLVTTALSNGDSVYVTSADLKAIDVKSEQVLYLSPSTTASGQKLKFYRGTTLIGESTTASLANDKWYGFKLQPGRNDIGILYTRQDSAGNDAFINFCRYSIVLGDNASPTPTKSAADPAEVYFGQWQLTDFQLTSYTGMTADFLAEFKLNNTDPKHWLQEYIGDFNDVFTNTDDLDNLPFYHAEIRIGEPVPGAADSWAGKYFFQTNTSTYIGGYNVVVDGIKQNYRQMTIPASLETGGSLHVQGYEGTGGLDDNDMYIDMVLSPIDVNNLRGSGTIRVNAHDGGMIMAHFTCTMKRTSRKPGLVGEYS